MIAAPPGEPVAISKLSIEPSPARLNTSVGAIELRGRLWAGSGWRSGRRHRTGCDEKSVSSLFSRKPRTKRKAAHAAFDRGGHGDDIAFGIDDRHMRGALALLGALALATVPGKVPGCATPMLLSKRIRLARLRR